MKKQDNNGTATCYMLNLNDLIMSAYYRTIDKAISAVLWALAGSLKSGEQGKN